MTQPNHPISPLRQRMIEDMRLRKLAPKTQASYIAAVKKLAAYLGHSPHTATAEDLRRFQLHLTDAGTSRITINTTITALRFFFEVTVGDNNVVGKLKTVPDRLGRSGQNHRFSAVIRLQNSSFPFLDGDKSWLQSENNSLITDGHITEIIQIPIVLQHTEIPCLRPAVSSLGACPTPAL